MTIEIEPQPSAGRPDEVRRRLLLSGLAGGAALAMSQNAQAEEKTPGAGPIKAARGSQLSGKVAVVTGAARGIGRPSPWNWRRTEPTSPPLIFATL